LLKIAALTGVSTATVRVALGRVAARSQAPAGPAGDADSPAGTPGHHEDDEDGPQDGAEIADLVVLAAPEPRTTERVAARFGDLLEAPVVITQGAQLPLAGLLLALPALEMTGLLPVATETFPPMRKGFYGLRATLLMGVFLALLREPRAEAATRIRPTDLGRLLGLDRAPEVKTLRRKLSELAAHGKGAALQAALGRHHATTRPDAVGFLYLDGHVRVYTGTRELPKTHIARMRIAGPATEETWVGDADGDPVMVITAAPSRSLAAALARLLPDLRAIIGRSVKHLVDFVGDLNSRGIAFVSLTDHHSREVPRCGGQGRAESPHESFRVRRTGRLRRVRLHGHPWIRPGVSRRDRGRWRQHGVLYDRSGIGLRRQTCPFHQVGHEQRRVPPHVRRHGHQLRRHPGR
jgi:hypothetical protein